MEKFNLSKKLFDFEEYDSDISDKTVIYISSSEDESSDWETDCSTDTEQLIARIEREVTSSPMLIGGRIMTMDEPEDEARAGPSTSQVKEGVTPKLGLKYFDREMCYAPPRKFEKKRIELCNTIMPVLESPMSPRSTRGGQVWTPPLSSRTRVTFMRPTMCKIQYPIKMSWRYAIQDAWFAAAQWTQSRTKR